MKKFKSKFLVSMMCISLIVPQFINEIATSEVAIVYANESELDLNLNQNQNQTPKNNTNYSETPDNADKDNTSLEGKGESITGPEGAGGDDSKPEGAGGDDLKPEGTVGDTPKIDNTSTVNLNPDGVPEDETNLDSIENLDLNPDNLLGDETDLEAIDDVAYEKQSLGKMKGLRMMPYSNEEAAGAPTSAPHGSGSYQLNEVGTDYRFYTEYFVKADTKKSIKSAGVDRKTSIKVYAKAGEIILFGSSVFNSQINENNEYIGNVTGKDILITTPSGSKICMDVLAPGEKESDGTDRPNGLGYIQTPTQEMNGPMVNYADESHPEMYYVPLQYVVPENGDGVYTFEFHSITGFNPNSASNGYHPSPKRANEAWAQGNTAVAAWDITVLGKKTDTEWEVKSGRAWADYLALTTGGGAGIQSDMDVHVLTHDGYQYKVDFKAAVPYGFIFFANNTGFMSAITDEDSHTTTYRPIYHSFYDASNDLDYMSSAEKIYLHKPDEADTGTQETYKIFFNAPSIDLNGVIYKKNEQSDPETIKTAPSETVSITDLKFSGGSYDNIARTGHGGYFSFTASDEAIVTLRLDLRKAILESKSSMSVTYRGSGIVEISIPVTKGNNLVYWDGKDTDGYIIPAGIYGNSNVVLATEVKRGELHFPVIDMEGLIGGLQVERINGVSSGDDANNPFNLYYNNNPLVYGTIEGSAFSKKIDGTHYVLSDGTKTYKSYTDRSATKSDYFTYGDPSISTLKKDDKDYLAKKMFNSNYADLLVDGKAIIDAEFETELATYHFEPVNTKNFSTTMKFNCSGFDGGGNQAGIDAWTYYTQGIDSQLISFAIMDTNERGIVQGKIFYDADISSSYAEGTGDYLLPGVKVRLINSQGIPVKHTESLPCFDTAGNFIYESDGKVKYEDRDVIFETVTDSTGTYRFTGVPYSSTEDTTYYVQVLLTDVQSEVLRYTCTTSMDIKEKLKTSTNSPFIPEGNSIDSSQYGADGNKFSKVDDVSKIYGYKYDRDSNNETVFDFVDDELNQKNTQSVTFSANDSSTNLVRTESFKSIGYSSTVPVDHIKDYKLTKNWGENSHGDDTHKISDGLIVELWVWNDTYVHEENDNPLELSRRTGALMDTQVLNEENHWTYTWKNLDDRLQYYVLEYYTKKKSDGEVIYNDRGEPRKVLIGGTMPIFSTIPEGSIYASKGIYGFKTNLGDYPETIPDPDDNSKSRIPIQIFNENKDNPTNPKVHANSITKKEKLESVDNNARQYNVTYTLKTEVIEGRQTNTIDLTNSQVYDDRTYYVWLNHQTQLPDLIAQTYVQDNKRNSHAVTLVKDTKHPLEDGTYCIKGLSVSSLDAASVDNVEGNATTAFRIAEDDKKYALFTATNHGNYKTGIGTRTYQVKYVVDASTKAPVSVTAVDGKLVLTDNHTINVEGNINYIVYSWYMTVHVYDVVPDGVIEYNSNNGSIVLQQALPVGNELTWVLEHDGTNYNAIKYTSNDDRTSGILQNDILRVPLYKAATDYNMGSCADIVGIAYSEDGVVMDISTLDFADTYESRYGSHDSEISKEDGKAIAQGSGGFVEINLNTKRITRINRTQDHANYADITFTPKTIADGRKPGLTEDVFYYKIIIFAEDNTYQYHSYDEIDATEGVVMYTYFTMKSELIVPKDDSNKPNGGPGDKPKDGLGDNPDGDTPSEEPDNFVVQTIQSLAEVLKNKLGLGESGTEKLSEDSEEDNLNVKGTKAPLTGDYSNWILWGGIFLLSACALVTVFLLWCKKNKIHYKKRVKTKKRKKRKGRASRRK